MKSDEVIGLFEGSMISGLLSELGGFDLWIDPSTVGLDYCKP